MPHLHIAEEETLAQSGEMNFRSSRLGTQDVFGFILGTKRLVLNSNSIPIVKHLAGS